MNRACFITAVKEQKLDIRARTYERFVFVQYWHICNYQPPWPIRKKWSLTLVTFDGSYINH